MKKRLLILLMAAAFLLPYACSKIAPAFTVKSHAGALSAVYLTFANGTGGFSPVQPEPYDSAITIEIPWYYPDGSLHETSVDSLIITGTLPNSAYLSPAFGLQDFTAPRTFTVTAQSGAKQPYTVTVVRKKSSKAEISSFKLKEAGISGVVAKNKVIIPFADVDLTHQTAQVELSNYASITPDPAVARDYSSPVEYTVTAQDGTQVVYTVSLGMPVKLAKGFGSVKTLWTKSAGDLGFEDYRQISIAVSGDYFLLPNSNEWVSGSSIAYYDRKTGGYAGALNTTGAERIYSIASDSNGRVVGINSLYAGNNVSLYSWSNVSSAPVLLARTTDWSSVGGAFYGRKISVYGDLTKDAVIMATSDGSSAGGANNILRWTIKNGSLVSQDPAVITYGSAFSYVAKAVPTNAQAGGNFYFVSNAPSFMQYLNGSTGGVLSSFSSDFISSPRGNTPALTYFEFNNAKYAAVIDASAYSSAMHIFDVTDPSAIGTSVSSGNYSAFHVFDGSAGYVACPSPNLNVTGEIAAGPVSSDGYTMTVYFLVTNGGVVAYELSCLDLNAYN